MLHRWLILAGLMLAAACGPATPTTPPASLKILTTTTILADITRNIVGDKASVESFLPAGADPHAYQATPQDAVKMSESDVLILNGAEYEHTFQGLLDNARGTKITASDGLSPETINGEVNPHFWVNPQFAVKYVENIRDGLTQADPGNGDIYRVNAEAYIKQLNDLDAWAEQQVATLPHDRLLLVTNHDALGYFADRYGFRVIGVIIPSASDTAGTSAVQMAAVIEAVRTNHAPAIFLDEVENPKLAQQIADETGAEVVGDLYFESLSGADGPAATYLDMIHHDVSRIVQALAP
jgi:ABC-type Zn uptake system ZnuABC Zn-binding protein ZnuA